MKKNYFILCLLVVSLSSNARVKNPKPGKLFDDTRVHTIEILMDTADFKQMDKNRESNEMYPATFIIHYADETDTVRNIGVRPKGNFSRKDAKMSYKLGFNSYEKGRKYKGLEKLNLNSYYHEPTHLRAHLSAKLYAYAGLPVTRTAFADVYLNGSYKGLYNVVEHIDEEFVESRFGSKEGNLYKCLLGANLAYLGPEVSHYDTLMGKRPKYQLKTNEEAYDYSGLIELTDILTNTPPEELESKLEQRFNVEDYLKSMAVEVLLGGWDGYLLWCNNYYLYDNPETGKFEFIAYDFDHTFGRELFGLDMGNKNIYDYTNYEAFYFDPDTIPGITPGAIDTLNQFQDIFRRDTRRPLYDRLMAIDKYRNQYNYHLQYLIDNYFNSETMNGEIDRLFTLLTPSLKKDSLDPFDWETTEKAIDRAINSGPSIKVYKINMFPYGLTDYVAARTASIKASLEPVKPMMTLNHVSEKQKQDTIIIRVSVEGVPPERLSLIVLPDRESTRELLMHDDGLQGDKKAGDGIYSCRLPEAYLEGSSYYIASTLPDGEFVREPFSGYFTNVVENLAAR